MSFIAAFYVAELCNLVGIESFNNCILIMFAYTSGICMNLSNQWKSTAICVLGSMGYFFLRLGIHFHEFKVDLITICLICCVFYIANVVVFELSARQDKALINKFSNMGLSMCRLLDYLPHAIYIEKDGQVLYYNKKLLEITGIPEEKQNNPDFSTKVKERLSQLQFEDESEPRKLL